MIAAYRGKCPVCGHDHDNDILSCNAYYEPAICKRPFQRSSQEHAVEQKDALLAESEKTIRESLCPTRCQVCPVGTCVRRGECQCGFAELLAKYESQK